MVYGFATDHREVKPGDAFLAIKGTRFDGHEFAKEAMQNGAVVVVSERPVSAPHILVPNLVDALARFGGEVRSTFDGPVIGITGSAGKTTTKEFVAAALSPLGKILRTEGNRNTEYTGPLMWAELDPDTQAVVVEMAMRGFGQIAHLAAFVKPTIGVITNIGYGHMEMVGSREGIAQAKGELLDALAPDGVAVLWAEDDYLEALKERAGSRRVVTFGTTEGADCQITDYRLLDWQVAIVSGVCMGQEWSSRLPVIGRHIALNAAAAILTAQIAGVEPAEATHHIQDAALPPMRMEIRQINGATILLDTYNASPPAMLAAIEALMELPVEGKRFAVIGEMKELGEHQERLHREVGRALNSLDEVLFYGDPMATFAREEALSAGLPACCVATSIEEVAEFIRKAHPGDAVLIKGSRALELERALEGLE